ncbi:MAG: hypothetical protein HKL95_10180 [Phycisphaerae bacterium]|nr:hypothetical protein [Phycisphaerae bacterium]
MKSRKYFSDVAGFRVRAAHGLGFVVGAVLLLGLLLLGGSWLISVVGTGPAEKSVAGPQNGPSVVPALAHIPWRNNACHPVRMRLYAASLPGYWQHMAVPWWWPQVRVAPADNPRVAGLLKALCRAQGRGRVRGLRQFAVWRRAAGGKAYPIVERTLLPAVLDARHYRTALGMTRLEILWDPANTGWVQLMLLVRTQALLAAQHPNRALDNALRLYNVCTMRDVRQVVVLIGECLQSGAMGAGPTARQFVAEQIREQYVPPATDHPCPLPSAFRHYRPGSSDKFSRADSYLTAWRRLNPQPYATHAARITGEDFNSLMRRGNLLLLANHCRQAALVWGRAYRVAQGAWQLHQAAEGIARTIKALDKAVGRANQWVDQVSSGGVKK